MVKQGRVARWAMVLAPLLALAACEQAQVLWEQVQGAARSAPEAAGPVPMGEVPVEARAVAGAVLPEAEIAAFLEMPPVSFVPGEILVGAKVVEAVAQSEGMTPAAFMRQRFQSGEVTRVLEALDLDEAVVRRATETAVDRARTNARTVLQRLRVEGEISAVSGGLMKIDLNPDGASPTRYQTDPAAGEGAAAPAEAAAPEAAPAEPAAPPAALETADLRCPTGVTTAQLEADLVLKTQCALERLRASRQFEFVEKNYVVTTAFEWPWNRPSAPAPKPTQPGPTQPGAGQPTPADPTPSDPGTAEPGPAEPGPTIPAPVTISLPNDPLLPLQWHYRPRGAAAGQSPGGAGFEAFWTTANQVGSNDVRVAVIDTGVDMSHPDFQGSPNLAPGIDLITSFDRAGDGDGIDTDANDSGDACGPTGANSYHGSHVAGTVGAAPTNKRRGVAGGAWNVTVVPIRALGRCGGELEDIVNAIRWAAGLAPATAEDGAQLVNPAAADVINLSLSVPIPCPASMQAAIDGAVAKGVVVVAAAGNKANPVKLFAPANCNNVVVVGAGDQTGGLAFYSNFGPEVDLVAPGGDMFADSDRDGRPDGVLSTRTSRSNCFDPETRNAEAVCYYSYLQGTSMAAPHVSAALALLKAQYRVAGKELEDLLFTRATGPLDPVKCEIACERNRNATPIPEKAGRCMRACGRGSLDLGLAATAAAGPASPGR